MNKEDLKLIYVHKVGYNAKGYGLFEFIFSTDHTRIDSSAFGWDRSPACDNAETPTEGYYDAIYTVTLKEFDLFCLHEAYDREYMHGYHNIHALAYETELETDARSSYDKMFNDDDTDDLPLLVFHYGMSLKDVSELFYSRNVKMNEQ